MAEEVGNEELGITPPGKEIQSVPHVGGDLGGIVPPSRGGSNQLSGQPVVGEEPQAEPEAPEAPEAPAPEAPEAPAQEPEAPAQEPEEAPVAEFNFLETFGEGYENADAVKNKLAENQEAISARDQEILALKSALRDKENPYKNDGVKMANKMVDKFGDKALQMATRLSSAKNIDNLSVAEALALKDVIDSPGLQKIEADLIARNNEKYQELKDSESRVDLVMMEENAEKAKAEIKALVSEYSEVTEEGANEDHVELIALANGAKDGFVDALSNIEINGVKVELPNVSEFAEMGVNMLLNGGSASNESIEMASKTIKELALGNALMSGEILEKIQSNAMAKAEEKLRKERVNAPENGISQGKKPKEKPTQNSQHLSAIDKLYPNV